MSHTLWWRDSLYRSLYWPTTSCSASDLLEHLLDPKSRIIHKNFNFSRKTCELSWSNIRSKCLNSTIQLTLPSCCFKNNIDKVRQNFDRTHMRSEHEIPVHCRARSKKLWWYMRFPSSLPHWWAPVDGGRSEESDHSPTPPAAYHPETINANSSHTSAVRLP